MLGATYSDLNRRAKMQETLFEILTKQYEISKVQEARDIPTVKVLDAPDVPEKKSFPPRLLIMVGGTLLAVVFAGAWVSADRTWRRVGADDPRKRFAIDVFATLRTRVWRRKRSAQL
jgi:uncharacterized protein involved in exopolysaccharide biosynthesis